MFSNELNAHISQLLGEEILNAKSLGGGDISAVYSITTNTRSFILKLNNFPNGEAMFQAEKFGLESIGQTQTIATPQVYACGSHHGTAFLLMEYIESQSASEKDFRLFGRQLAQLHRESQSNFGFTHDNFIGRLEQSNKYHISWTEFYLNERLLPQFQLALSQSLLFKNDIPDEQKMRNRCELLFENIRPALLHGDLWSGNYLISTMGIPYLIDPSVYYGHHDMDIAMSRLFGGFGNEFYKSYHEVIPRTQHFENRIQLYQLYYLLVHLNMFGVSYYGSVMRILKAQF